VALRANHHTLALIILGACAISTAAGLLCGLANGVLCTWLRVPSFIVTLGTLLVLRGLAYWISGGQTQLLNCPAVLSIAIPIGVSVLSAAAAGAFLATSGLGRRVYAVGGNWLAARYSGVRAGAVRIFAFGCSGACAGLAGVIYWSRTATGSYTAGEGYELYAIAAVVLGGTRLAGGEGTILGTFLGALIMSVLRNGLDSAGVHDLTQKIIVGSVLIVSAAIDSRRSRSGSPDWVP
jgi:ribose transport system permease protein